MKWARLMFGREFRVESVLLLWDHIFGSLWIEGRPDVPECIENVALAMVRVAYYVQDSGVGVDQGDGHVAWGCVLFFVSAATQLTLDVECKKVYEAWLIINRQVSCCGR